MKTVIAKLLERFEQGRMSRRELVQSLAVAATGAHVLGTPAEGAAQPAARSSAAAFRTTALDHISWWIADFDTDAVREELERRGLNPRRDQGGAGTTTATTRSTRMAGTCRSRSRRTRPRVPFVADRGESRTLDPEGA